MLTHRHTDLKDEFYARVRVQGHVSASEQQLRRELAITARQLTEAREENRQLKESVEAFARGATREYDRRPAAALRRSPNTGYPSPPPPSRLNAMGTLSNPTIGLLTEIAVKERTADELETLLLRADLKKDSYLGYDRGGSSKHGRVRPLLVGARELAESGDADAHRSLLTFTRALVEKSVADPGSRRSGSRNSAKPCAEMATSSSGTVTRHSEESTTGDSSSTRSPSPTGSCPLTADQFRWPRR